ncbi:glutamine-rich protein 2 [Bufo gargarizans]|uniref:glutamine-rich protein 2 n=1 Tax=Bufo gargarizans TaxID=30331 RepID=UPI001CF1D897|nr:glutamine-rich protein 2 [Bufo gargarizans]
MLASSSLQAPDSTHHRHQGECLEKRILHLEKQLEVLNNLPSGLDLIARSTSGQQGGSSPVEDMWQMMKLKSRLEVNEEGVCKAMAVLQDLMLEVNILKESQREVQDQIQKMPDTAGVETGQQLEQRHGDTKPELEEDSLQKELELLKAQMKELEEKCGIVHKTLTIRPDLKDPIISDTTRSRTQWSSQDGDSALPVETLHGPAAGTLEDPPIEVNGQPQERDLLHAHPGAPVPQNNELNSSMSSMDPTAAPGSPGVAPSISKEHVVLYARLDTLERDKADRVELGRLQKNSDDLAATLNHLKREIQDLRGDPHKSDQLQRSMDPFRTSRHGQTLDETSLDATIQDIEKELKELRERGKLERAVMEETVADDSLQPQDQEGELMGHNQKRMAQLQEECERLIQTMGSLIQDLQQKQRHIDVLYQTVEDLTKNKLDAEHIGPEIDAKADKRVLDRKVSRTQFDATTEHLSRMIQELLGKMSAQEQDWQRLLEKISLEMQNKLDRVELEPLKNILEQCWRDLHRQLEEHPPQYEADEAAGIRKQLLRRFQCLSCDRTVNMLVPGSEILTIPNIPGLPAHRSNRPYTVFELDQIRQQSRSDRLPQTIDFGFTSSSRNCGGSHTLTFPQRRYTRLQAGAPSAAQKEDTVGGLKDVVFMLGQDGNIYRGRRDYQLPAIRNKDGKRVTVAHQKICDCNLKGEENLNGCSSVMASDIHYGVSKAHMKSSLASEEPLPSIKDSLQPACT